jgi:hypothetical protein
MRLSLYVVVVGLFWTLSAFIIQQDDKDVHRLNQVNFSPETAKEEVKKELIHAWKNYKRFAWGSDELCSLTKVFSI